MTIVENPDAVVGGVDTHADVHVAAAINHVGGVLGVESFPTTSNGYRRLVSWLRSHGELSLVGVEGTGSYGVGLSRYLQRAGVDVVEVDRPNRQTRHRQGKSDPVDAVAAARAALLPDGNTAEAVRTALAETVQRLPEHLWRSLTWDQGKEMAQHAQFSVDTGVDVYFCDPQSPWQRGTNENTNGLLRQYFSKGTDMSQLTQDDLDQAAYSLNTRPRQTLGRMTPSDKLAETLR